MFLLLCFVYMVVFETDSKQKTKQYRKPQRKVTKLKSKFYFYLG